MCYLYGTTELSAHHSAENTNGRLLYADLCYLSYWRIRIRLLEEREYITMALMPTSVTRREQS
ncbi:hypothetical protein CANCADRAFT_32154 [Tortispora caseinolytica NRRL Y-17796]|uniref:Uncharacterized protein n=1 Tax=Tortispora caseinolytica NRRL Y-17796 TaxID=767744 RepID=A0A1E4TA03_9ASCO|nr:hypothetical protein CANCADRAFT_32154 [Tortispora caseinolytica NRRL Y-17796]